MVHRFTGLLEERYGIGSARAQQSVRLLLTASLAIVFALCCTVIVGFDDLFQNATARLIIGSVPSEDIIAREEGIFVSEILTQQERADAVDQVSAVFDPPDPNVARQQRELTEKVLVFIDNVRGDDYASLEQKIADINQITPLILEGDEETVVAILELPEDSWSLVRGEIISVLERVMRDPIRDADLENVRDQLPTQVSLRLSPLESQIVTVITGDVIRANTFENPEQTALDRDEALENVEPQQRHFVAGQIVAAANQRIDNLSFEALQELGLLVQTSNRGSRLARALLASSLVTVMLGLYISRFETQLMRTESQTMLLLAILFLIALSSVRIFGTANIYLLPAAALGMLYVALGRPHLALVAAVGLAFLGGLLNRSPSLEIASLIAAGNFAAILTLRNAGRLNNYFLSGALAGISNAAVVAIFALLIGADALNVTHLLQAFVNGLLIVPTTSFAAMYALTIMFNLPTPFKLMDLSQPSKPLLQRLLREAPGTYQHSLQVANLAEQAAAAIGADGQLTHVAALYHDIGKMNQPFFYTENQQQIHNPHDSLDDPYRSAHIIIDHVVEGDHMARRYNLPQRIRDFIREHHGTTKVFVFYQRAIKGAEDESDVDATEFMYPGPVPQSRETAVLMMADSCESAIRAVQPESNQEIATLVHRIIEEKRNDGQLDASNLTLNDLRKIEETFIDIFRGLFHPRIDYSKAISPASRAPVRESAPASATAELSLAGGVRAGLSNAESPTEVSANDAPTREKSTVRTVVKPKVARPDTAPKSKSKASAPTMPAILDDDEPIDEVPPLPKRNGTKNSQDLRAEKTAPDASDIE